MEEKCLDEFEIADYAAGVVIDDATMKRVRKHLQHCDKCKEYYYQHLIDVDIYTKTDHDED